MTSTTTLVTINAVRCCSCHAYFGIDAAYETLARQDGRSFHCPYCQSSLSWAASSENKKLRDELAREKHRVEQAKADAESVRRRLDAERVDHAHTSHRLRAHKGVVTKIKKRVAKGVCPCCHQKFKDLRDHMVTRHPGWNPEKGAEVIAEKSK